MSRATIEFLAIGTGNSLLNTYKNRVIDWVENGSSLLLQMKQYKEEYRMKICSSCSVEQQQKRNCHRYVIDGREITSCNHMDIACGRKFKKKLDSHWDFHPALSRVNVNNVKLPAIYEPELEEVELIPKTPLLQRYKKLIP